VTTTVQARLDEKTQAVLDRLRQRGLTTSEVIREGIHLVENQQPPDARPRLVGIGCVSFGPGDLATNKKHMEGFGKKWRVDKQGNGKWDW
jgi:hypothetical protein